MNKILPLIDTTNSSGQLHTVMETPLYVRRSFSDANIVPGIEIELFFQRISDGKDKLENINQLISIAASQQFSGTPRRFDILFNIINNKANEEPIVWEKTFELLNKMASFTYFSIQSGLSSTHLEILFSHIPYHYAVKCLGKIVSMHKKFSNIVASFDLTNIISMFSEESYSLFIWFISCFSNNESLNEEILPFYTEYIFDALLSSNPSVSRNAVDAIRVLSKQSYSISEWIILHPLFPNLLNVSIDDRRVLKMLLQTFIQLTKVGKVSGLENLIDAAFESEQTDIILLGLELIDQNIHDDFDVNRYAGILPAIFSGPISFKVQKQTSEALLSIFPYCSTQNKEELFDTLVSVSRFMHDYGNENAVSDVLGELYRFSQGNVDRVNFVEDLALELDVDSDLFC